MNVVSFPREFVYFFFFVLQLIFSVFLSAFYTVSLKLSDVNFTIRDCIRSSSEKRDSENKQKFAFLLRSTNKDSLCSGI